MLERNMGGPMDTSRYRSMGPVIAFFLVFAACGRLASGGPDHHMQTFCNNFYKALKIEQRYAIRDVVQTLQATDAQLGLLRQGLPLSMPLANSSSISVNTLEEWRHGNATKLLALVEATNIPQWRGLSVPTLAAAATGCLSSRLNPDRFIGRPVMSILLNYFKRPRVVSRIPALIYSSCKSVGLPCELVINVDNPHEAEAWAAEAAAGGAGPGFVVPVFSANLHEARGYNRAAKLARGRYFIIWQDDQVPPPHGQWLLDMVKVFDTYPKIGVMGMNTYRLCRHMEPTNRFGYTLWQPDPKTGVKWTYAQSVDFAPLVIRASIFAAVGTLDEDMARPGDCGIWSDWELSSRVIMDGWQVGFMFVEGRTGDGEPGTTHKGANGEKCWGRQQMVASSVVNKRFDRIPVLEAQCERVWLQNMQTFTAAIGRCPYGSVDTRYGNCTVPPDTNDGIMGLVENTWAGSDMDTASAAASVAATLAAAGARGTVGGGGADRGAVSRVGHGAGGSGSDAAVTSTSAAAGGAAGGPGAVIEMNPLLVRGGRRQRRLLK